MQQLKRSEIVLLFKLAGMKASILLIICFFVGCLSGCKTGGSWVESSSPNVTVVSPSNLTKTPTGTYSLKNGNTAPKQDKVSRQDIPQVINEPQKTESKTLSKKIQGEAVKSKPVAPANSSAEAQPLPAAEVEAANGDYEHKPIEIVDIAMNVIPENNNAGVKVDKTPDTVIINEDEMKIDWPALIFFYFIAIMVLILTWMVYDLIKDFIYNKDRSQNPFSKKEKVKENKSSINNSKKLKRASKRQ